MGFRFRRSVRIIPGVRLNFSKSGISTSFGGRGASYNIGLRGTKTTFGIPGTGLSWSQSNGGRARPPAVYQGSNSGSGGALGCFAILAGIVGLAMCSSGSKNLSTASPSAVPSTTNSALPSASDSESAEVTSKVANCRADPDLAGKLVEKMDQGTIFPVLERRGGWVRADRGGSSCWISSALVAAAASSTRGTASTAMLSQTLGSSTPADTPRQTRPETLVSRKADQETVPDSAYYRNCSEARAAGAAPIYRGQPGYASHLDRDDDGIACE
jgi:hypothetical protein